MDRKSRRKLFRRSNSEQLEINAKLFNVTRKRNISVQEKLQKIQKLLEKTPQPDINAQDGNDNWNTALHLAIKKNELEVVKFLLTQGANTTIENGDGKTSLDLAEELNHVQIIDALKSRISQAEWLCNDFTLGEALEGAGCFFDAVAQGLSASCVPGGPFNVQSLRQSCCDYARDIQDDIYDSQTGKTWLQAISENDSTGGYATGSSRQADFESYLAKLKEDSAIWGRSHIEGRMLCKIYGIKLHLLEKQTADSQDIFRKLVDSSGSRAVTMYEITDLYKEPGVIHLLNEAQARFFPILPKFLVHTELTEKSTRRPQSETDSNSHAAATGKQGATTVLPPFSGKITVDTELKLSHDDFEQGIDLFYKNKKLSSINQLKATPAFPTPHILAKFASMAYTDYQREEPKPPDGWRLLTTASHFGARNGYFGTAYWHPENQQVVISHRGTDIRNVGALVTDIKGVLFNNCVNQMSSASTFANKVVAVMQEIEQENGVSFELFFTGHSLGGWLAQITTFTTKYLEEKNCIFLKKLKTEENEPLGSSTDQDSQDFRESYHPHTVVFDSPGCKDMLLQMTDKFDVRLNGRSIDLQHLDITSYLSAPNRINTCNSHLGTVYRIFIDLSHMSSWRKRTLTYTPNTHSMDKIVEAFDPKTGQKDDKGELNIREVVDWPVSAGLTGGREYDDFFKWAQHLNNYHPEVMDTVFSNVPEGYNQLRYQTKAYDECARSLSVFTQDEREFLEHYRWLCHVSEFFKPEDSFSVMNNTEAQHEAEQKLRNFQLGNESVSCEDASKLQALIPYVKRLVRLFPRMKEDIKAKLSSSQIRSRVYQYETQRYVENIHQSALEFNPGTLGLIEFLSSDQQIWQLRMNNGDAWTGLTKVYRVFQKTSCEPYYFSEGRYTVLNLKRLLKFNRLIKFSTLLASMEKPHLLMIACETNQPLTDELRDMFKQLFHIPKQKKTVKIILTTPSEDSIAAFLQQIAHETVGERLKTTDEQLIWSDLTRNSQRKVLETVVIFQGRRVPLNQLTSAESVTNSFPLADLLQETKTRIGEELVPSACSGYSEKHYIDRTFHHNIITRQDISSDEREGKFADLLASDEQEFKQLCQRHPTRNVHCLVKVKSGELIWQRSQGNLKSLRKYIDAQKSHSYDPKDLDKLLGQARHHRIMLIADKAGMGKSTVLTHLSKQIKQQFPTHWLVRIDLNDYTVLLEALKGKKMDKERVLEFVSKEVLKLESPLEQLLFKKNFEGYETIKAVIMLDGFDEISPSYKQTVIDMLQVLKQTSLEQLWVTTRPHLREELEDELQQLAYTLQPFSEVEQVKFLNKFRLQYLNPEDTNQSRLEIYATALIRKLAQSISDKDKEFAGIPLQTRMLAETFQEKFISFYLSENSEPDLPHKLDLQGLYGQFIDRKYYIYYKEKLRGKGNVGEEEQREHYLKGIQLQHQQLALQALFTEDYVTRLQIDNEFTFSEEKLARIGIVQRNHEGRPQFIHRTFAEYCVADFLITQLTKKTKQHIHVQEFLLNKVLLRTDCHVIRAFLDGLLGKSEPSKEVLKEYGEKLDKQWSGGDIISSLIGLIQTALRQAATEDNTHVIGLLLDSLKSVEHSNALRNMLLATDARGRSAWHMAANEGKVDALKKIWECVDEMKPTVTSSLPLLKDMSDENASHLAKNRGHINSLEKPWNSAKEAQIYAEKLKIQMLLAQDSDGKTALHLAAENCNEEVLQKIWGWARQVQVNPNELQKKLVLVKSNNGQTAWHLAAQKCSLEIMSKLWSCAKEAQLKPHEFKNELLLLKDKIGKITWHLVAILTGNFNVIEALWSWAKEAQLKPNELSELLLAKDMNGNTAWHAAVKSDNLEKLETLCSWNKEAQLKPDKLSELLLAKSDYGDSPWHVAARSENLKVLQTLWSWAKEAELKPNELSELLLAKDRYGITAWHAAVKSDNLEKLETLCSWAKEAQLKPDKLSELLLAKSDYGDTPWHVAARSENLKVLQILCSWAKEAQLKPNELSELLLAKDRYGITAWHAAVKSDNLKVLETLWSWANEAQLKPNELSELLLAKDIFGKTAWHAAVNSCNIEKLDTLWSWAEEAQLKPNELSELLFAKVKYGNTAWLTAAERGNLEKLEKLWSWTKEAQLKPDEKSELLLAKDMLGKTAWEAVVREGNIEDLETLWNWAKEAQLKPNEKSELLLAKFKLGKTAWEAVVREGNLETLWNWAKEAQLKPKELSELLLAKDKYGNTAWHAAAERENSKLLDALFSWAKEAQLKPNELSTLLLVKDKYGNTAWHAAVRKGNIKNLEKLWSWAKEAQLKPNEFCELLLAKDKYGNTVWHAAVRKGNIENLEKLWSWAKKEQPKPNKLCELLLAKDKYGNTACHVAAERKNSKLLEALLSWAKEAQLKPNELSELLLANENYVYNALHAAVESGNTEKLETLWSWAKEALLKPNELSELLLAKENYVYNAWHAAVESGNIEKLETLWSWAKEAQLKPNELGELSLVKDRYGSNALHATVKSGNLETLETLRSWAKEAQLKTNELGELLLVKDSYDNNALHAAVKGGNLEILETLRSWTKEAQLKQNQLGELLLDKDRYGSNVLHAAVKGGNLETLQTLRSWTKEAQLKQNVLGELLLAKDYYGKTAWHAAAGRKNSKLLEALCSWAKEEQLKPNTLSELLLAKDMCGNTAWHAAVKSGNLKNLETLCNWALEAQLKPNKLNELLLDKGKYRNTAWHAAAECDNLNVLEALCSLAKVPQLKTIVVSELLLAKDKLGNTAWQAVVREGNIENLDTLWSLAKEAQLNPNELRELLQAKDEHGCTVWLTAVSSDNLKLLEALCSCAKKAQLKPNELSKLFLAEGKYYNTAWHAAAREGNLKKLETLWISAKEAQLKPNELCELLLAKNFNGNTAWHATVGEGNIENLETLWSWAKEAQLKPNVLSELLLAEVYHGRTAWYAAAESENLKVLEALWSWAKEAQLKPNELSELLLAKDVYGNTAFHATVRKGNIENLEALWSWAMDAQLNPNELSKLLLAKDRYGNTVLSAATRYGF